MTNMQTNTLYDDVYAEQHIEENLTGGQFELVSAGLVNYLPAIEICEHDFIYQQILLHRRLSMQEQLEPSVLEKTTCEGNAEECLLHLKTKPAIVCTMHTGSYRVINLLLLQQGIPFTLVAGTAVLQKEGEEFRNLYRKMRKNETDELQLIDAEDSNALLAMLRCLKKGRSLVLYLDGQTGAGTRTNENSNSCVVDFLNQQLYARKGIAFMAHAAQVPIVPVLCYRKNMEDIRLHFYSLLAANSEMSRDVFATEITQQLYTLFSELIVAYPEQWEGWLTIHKNAKIINRKRLQETVNKKGENLVVDATRFGIFKTGGMPFILEKQEYLFYAVDDNLYELLIRCRREPVKQTVIHDDLLTMLLQKGVLKYV